jgi:hypothetical protein
VLEIDHDRGQAEIVTLGGSKLAQTSIVIHDDPPSDLIPEEPGKDDEVRASIVHSTIGFSGFLAVHSCYSRPCRNRGLRA